MGMRETREINQEKEAALKKVLSPGQFDKVMVSKEEMREKFEQRIMNQKRAPSSDQ